MANTSEMLQKMTSKGQKQEAKVKKIEKDESTDIDAVELSPPDLPIPSLGDVLKQCLSNKKDEPKPR